MNTSKKLTKQLAKLKRQFSKVFESSLQVILP